MVGTKLLTVPSGVRSYTEQCLRDARGFHFRNLLLSTAVWKQVPPLPVDSSGIALGIPVFPSGYRFHEPGDRPHTVSLQKWLEHLSNHCTFRG